MRPRAARTPPSAKDMALNTRVDITGDGQFRFLKGKEGVPTYPNLQFWDEVKRNLDTIAKRHFGLVTTKWAARRRTSPARCAPSWIASFHPTPTRDRRRCSFPG